MSRRTRVRRYAALHARVGSVPLVSVGALERGDPIPPGVYWLDIVSDALAPNGIERADNYNFWFAANVPPAAPEARVRTLKQVHRAAGPAPGNVPYTEDPFNEIPASDWILFEVLKPVNRWGHDTGLGLPTVAPRGAATIESDTIQSPEPEKEFWEGTIFGVPTWVATLGGIALVGVVVYAASR